jgi:hypothetical protein
MRRIIRVKKHLFHGYLCSDCGWSCSASVEILWDKPSTVATKKAFNAHDRVGGGQAGLSFRVLIPDQRPPYLSLSRWRVTSGERVKIS